MRYFFNCSFEVNEVQSLNFVTFVQSKVNKVKKKSIYYNWRKCKPKLRHISTPLEKMQTKIKAYFNFIGENVN